MGALITAACSCGFKADFTGGSGRYSYATECSAPALCLKCRTFQVHNYFDRNAPCHTCGTPVIFYNAPGLQQDPAPGGENGRPDLFELPRGSCLCPRCGSRSMRFAATGCWG